MAQKIVQYQAVLQLAQGAPQLYNMPLLHRQMLEVFGVKDINNLIPMDEDQKPTDPVTENQNVLNGKPVKAFLTQDHQAHIVVHMAAMQDPKIQALLQQNPMAPQMQSAMQAHVNEHLGFEYRKQIEETLGMQLPAQTDESGEEVHMDPEVEARLSPMLAQAAQQLLQKNTQQAQQAQQQQQAQDPIVQMQMQELQLKAQENQRKVAKDQADNAIKTAQQQIERERIQTQQETDDKRIRMDALKTVAQMKADKEGQMLEKGVDIMKQLSNKSHEEQLRNMQERIQMRQQQNRQPKKGE
jgi:hypothetical protein